MNIALEYFPKTVNAWDITRSLAEILHSDEFCTIHQNKCPLNFEVVLNPSGMGGVHNNGSGILQLPTEVIGQKLLKWAKETPIRIKIKKIKMHKKGPVNDHVALTLQRMPFVNPDIEEEWEDKCQQLDSKEEHLVQHAYSIEWERDYAVNSAAWLKFKYEHRLICINLGNKTTETEGQTIAISFSSIQKMAVSYDGKPLSLTTLSDICFNTLTPPIFEAGDNRIDNYKYKHHISSLYPGHVAVSQYAQYLQLLLYNDLNGDVIKQFKNLCQIAGIATNHIISFTGPWNLEASKQGFFEQKRLWKFWSVVFQLESLLHNCLLLMPEIEALVGDVKEACHQYSDDCVGSLLQSYAEGLQNHDPCQSPVDCFKTVNRKFIYHKQTLSLGHFLCCHVTFVLTHMILEGPYPTQSNRIIRKYTTYEEHFIHVDFHDEDRLSYWWDGMVDGASFVHTKHIFNVTADYIRHFIGNFKGTELMTQPSKWAARIGQAFTATDPSVKVKHEEWAEMPDIGEEMRSGHVFAKVIEIMVKALFSLLS
ncbi:hypothetical protein EDD18DRAFT_1101583 [Armillaria luteobubalina]|uniref:RNA-dependent RNA polymerase n=1 Tax=Armillaria luteobubalina TaxID=153913 RepID=A0AA39QHC8_9AGAR|nr:hypothetical protein EDD18DRAFT_1101583 [Armillaria luteobubalina]